MKIEISPEAFNAMVKEYEKYMDLYDEATEDDPSDDLFASQQAFCSLFEIIGMVIAEVVEEGLDDWCEQNRSVMEAALREAQEVT